MSTSLRQQFADMMLEVGRKDPKLVVLIGDISHFILQPFAKACPGRFYNVGICENTIMSMAAGLSKVGLYPVVHTIAPFIIERSFEQIKLDFGYMKLGVNILCVGSAFDYADLGCTHHSYGDFALLKTIQQMQIFYPASNIEFDVLFKSTYRNGLPKYFRIPKYQHDTLFDQKDIVMGRGICVKEGSDVTILAVGPQLKTATDAVELMRGKGISPEILYMHTIKPFDHALVNKSLKKTGRCLVIEEHGMYGGVFDDTLRFSKDVADVKYDSINLQDRFVHEYGTYQEHCRRLGFSAENVALKAAALCSKNANR
jgi:transketolase